jgi:protoporphyrin/coproporphyrin ferrochelatase
LVFTAHSIPVSMAKNCDYEAQLGETSCLIANALGIKQWRLVFQSRSGSPAQPWLGPDICDYLRELHVEGITDVVVAPIGFVSDHMEIIYDLDTEAMALCRELGLNMFRAATAGTHPAFVEMVRELILERIDPQTPRRSLGSDGPRAGACMPDCCASS